jgi:hypothetical protein
VCGEGKGHELILTEDNNDRIRTCMTGYTPQRFDN